MNRRQARTVARFDSFLTGGGGAGVNFTNRAGSRRGSSGTPQV